MLASAYARIGISLIRLFSSRLQVNFTQETFEAENEWNFFYYFPPIPLFLFRWNQNALLEHTMRATNSHKMKCNIIDYSFFCVFTSTLSMITIEIREREYSTPHKVFHHFSFECHFCGSYTSTEYWSKMRLFFLGLSHIIFFFRTLFDRIRTTWVENCFFQLRIHLHLWH